MEGYIAEIRMFAGNFNPKYWAFCSGQILAISTNTALFSLLGTTYGGNGQTTFALPDLRGRAPVGQGDGAGLSPYSLGERTGSETINILPISLPPHNHPVTGTIRMLTSNLPANAETPGNNYFANDGSPKYNTTNSGGTMKPVTVTGLTGAAGASTPVDNMMPFSVMNYIICVEGIFPSRN